MYQAYRSEIAEWAVKHQRFAGCPLFGLERMTWIKTSFLWMMYRCGWARKHNQERVLAIWVRRAAFEQYLESACTKGRTPGFKVRLSFLYGAFIVTTAQGTVRLQWDPDHNPDGSAHVGRRAVQLGLKGVTSFGDGTDVVYIEDVTPFVVAQRDHVSDRAAEMEELLVAEERVFTPESKKAIAALDLSPPPKK